MKNKFETPQPPVYFLASLVLITLAHLLFPLYIIVIFPWTLLGIVLMIIGITLNLLADHLFKIHNTTVKAFRKSHALISDNVFRISRNPMYLGMVLILAGVSVLMGSVSPWGFVFLFLFLIDRFYIQIEEKNLEEEFGATYQDYKNRVRRWI